MVTSAEAHRRPPPRAKWRDLFPLRRAFGSDGRAIMIHLARSYGPFVRTRLPMHIYFVSGPALIEEILVKQAANFRKDRVTRMLSGAIGDGSARQRRRAVAAAAPADADRRFTRASCDRTAAS